MELFFFCLGWGIQQKVSVQFGATAVQFGAVSMDVPEILQHYPSKGVRKNRFMQRSCVQRGAIQIHRKVKKRPRNQ